MRRKGVDLSFMLSAVGSTGTFSMIVVRAHHIIGPVSTSRVSELVLPVGAPGSVWGERLFNSRASRSRTAVFYPPVPPPPRPPSRPVSTRPPLGGGLRTASMSTTCPIYCHICRNCRTCGCSRWALVWWRCWASSPFPSHICRGSYSRPEYALSLSVEVEVWAKMLAQQASFITYHTSSLLPEAAG